jgi:indole-3-glycerol phosphate synthase
VNVLDELVTAARLRELPPPRVPDRRPPPLLAALARPTGAPIRVIAEVKRASPSQGVIRADADAVATARAYEAAGAAAISVLTEPTRFGGSFDDLAAVADAVSVPVLCKDFITTEAHILAATGCGAAGVLLIARAIPRALDRLVEAALASGVEALVEVHDELDLARALATPARLIGVNHRDLATLRLDRAKGEALLALVPPDRVRVAESGYEDAGAMRGAPADAVLVGTALMRDATLLATVTRP